MVKTAVLAISLLMFPVAAAAAPTPTTTESPTATVTATKTATVTATATATKTVTQTPTLSPTPSVTESPTPTATPTATTSPTPEPTPTITVTAPATVTEDVNKTSILGFLIAAVLLALSAIILLLMWGTRKNKWDNFINHKASQTVFYLNNSASVLQQYNADKIATGVGATWDIYQKQADILHASWLDISQMGSRPKDPTNKYVLIATALQAHQDAMSTWVDTVNKGQVELSNKAVITALAAQDNLISRLTTTFPRTLVKM